MANGLDFAYAAGLIDGEGCIGVYNQTCPTTKTKTRYSLSVRIQMSDWEAVLWMENTFGGCYRSHPQLGYGTRIMYEWVLSSKMAGEFLKQILPYLKNKKRQAELAILFQDKRKKGGRKNNAVREAEQILADAIKREKRRLI
jgi:hypothetical protein